MNNCNYKTSRGQYLKELPLLWAQKCKQWWGVWKNLTYTKRRQRSPVMAWELKVWCSGTHKDPYFSPFLHLKNYSSCIKIKPDNCGVTHWGGGEGKRSFHREKTCLFILNKGVLSAQLIFLFFLPSPMFLHSPFPILFSSPHVSSVSATVWPT